MIIFRISVYIIIKAETCDLFPKSHHFHKSHSAQENSIRCLYILILHLFWAEK